MGDQYIFGYDYGISNSWSTVCTPYNDGLYGLDYSGFSSGTTSYTPTYVDLSQSSWTSLGTWDYVSAGLAGVSTGYGSYMTGAGVAASSLYGVQYGIPSLLADLPGGVGAAVSLGQSYQAWDAGDYTGATQAGYGGLGAIAGAELGPVVGEWLGGLVGSTIGPWGTAAGAFVGAAIGTWVGYNIAEPLTVGVGDFLTSLDSPVDYTPYNAMGDFGFWGFDYGYDYGISSVSYDYGYSSVSYDYGYSGYSYDTGSWATSDYAYVDSAYYDFSWSFDWGSFGWGF